jgi:hypothetical protein
MADGGNRGDPNQGLGKLPIYLSPYEFWNFGAGLGYALPSLRANARFISAVAERPARHRRAAGADRFAPLGEHRPRLPTLWNPSQLSFVPFVAETPIGGVTNPRMLTDVLLAGFEAAIDSIEPAAIETSEAPELLSVPPRFRVALPVPDTAMRAEQRGQPSHPDWQPDGGLRQRIGPDKRMTVIAVIDDGLPFAHRNFRDCSGKRSRVEFCWLQSVAIDSKQDSVLFGREYTRDQIEHLIACYGGDEDMLYHHAGATADADEYGSLIDRHATHGAHVMDLAAGYAPERGEEPPEEIRIIAVQLPNAVTVDTSGFGKDMYLLAAFHYIFDRADIIAGATGYDVENLRLVINFSYGYSAGRHDGELELEAAINELIELRRGKGCPTALVVPAGNTFLDRLHGKIGNSDFHDDVAALAWRVQPNDRTPSYLELWFSKGFDPLGYSVELWDPSGRRQVSLPVGAAPSSEGSDPGSVLGVSNRSGSQVGQISSDQHRYDPTADPEHNTGRWRVLVVLAPTEPENAGLPGAEAGTWAVVIRRGPGAGLLEQPIQCWIQRATDPEALRSGSRQSYFDDPKDMRYTPQGDLAEQDSAGAFVQRFGSLNGLATGRDSMIVGGYRLGAGLGSGLACVRPALYSSAGPLEPGPADVPVHCSSMSDRSRALPGTIAAGVRSGSRSLLQGTSVAAPFVARQLATIFVEACDDEVKKAENENYRALLCGWRPAHAGEDALTARLGAVRVPWHGQPAVEGQGYAQAHHYETAAALTAD